MTDFGPTETINAELPQRAAVRWSIREHRRFFGDPLPVTIGHTYE